MSHHIDSAHVEEHANTEGGTGECPIAEAVSSNVTKTAIRSFLI